VTGSAGAKVGGDGGLSAGDSPFLESRDGGIGASQPTSRNIAPAAITATTGAIMSSIYAERGCYQFACGRNMQPHRIRERRGRGATPVIALRSI